MASFCRPFFFNATATTEIYTLSLHDALPILVVNTHEDRQRALRISGGDRVLQFHGRGFRCGGWQIGFLVRSRLRRRWIEIKKAFANSHRKIVAADEFDFEIPEPSLLLRFEIGFPREQIIL